MSLEYAKHLADRLAGTEHHEAAQRLLRVGRISPGRVQAIVGHLRRRCVRAGIDPEAPDPWSPLPETEQLGREGLLLGRVPRTRGILRWLRSEWHYSALLGGAPGFGKTTLVCFLLLQLARLRVPAVVFDLRGDYEWLPLVIPDAVLIPWRRNRDNILRPLDDRTPRNDFLEFWATWFAESFGLMEASIAYLTQRLVELSERLGGRWADVLDLRTNLEQQNVTGHPEIRAYRDRILDKLRRVILACGEQFVGVQQGFDLRRLLNQGRLVIYRITAGKSLADFYTGLKIWQLYKSREFSEERFNQQPVFIVLDEQRSILRERSQLTDRIWEMDRGLTLARAMRISFIVAEQVVSELSRAVRVSTRLKATFNTQGDELRSTAEMMGLSNMQRAALTSLAPGQCVVTIGGNRCAQPVLIEVPNLNEQIQTFASECGV